jgi:hypothetical protein
MNGLTVIVVMFGCFAYDVSYNDGAATRWIASILGLS